jgi:hypothetical protein
MARYRHHVSGGLVFELVPAVDVPRGTAYRLPQHGVAGQVLGCFGEDSARLIHVDADPRTIRLFVRGLGIPIVLDYEPPPPPRMLGWATYSHGDPTAPATIVCYFDLDAPPRAIVIVRSGARLEDHSSRFERRVLPNSSTKNLKVEPIDGLNHCASIDVYEASAG